MLTINNPGKDWTHEQIRAALEKMQLKYWCMANEIGLKEQTPHTHVYFVAKNAAIRFSTVKGLFSTAHIEPARASSEENRAYVQKTGHWIEDEKADTSIPGTFAEWGEMPVEHSGQRTDWDIAYEMLADGQDVLDVIRAQTHMMRYRITLEQVCQELIAEEYRTKFRTLQVVYISGATWLGKTRYVMEKYGYENVCHVTGYQHECFDKYQCEDVLLLDEFCGGFRIQDLNNLLDGYPLMLPCRYANRVACFTKGYIISNIPLALQYPQVRVENPLVWDAFIRRIHKVLVFYDSGKYNEFTTQEYLNTSPNYKSETWREVGGNDDLPF